MPVGKWWGLFCREDMYDHLYELPRIPCTSVDGVFFLPPPVLELTFDEGLWTEINEQTGLLFDLGEEEEVEPHISKKIVQSIQRLANNYEGSDSVISRVVGQSNGKDIVVSMAAKDFSICLIKLVSFLEGEALKNNKVYAIF
jgi:hypothetical protein